MWLVELLGQLLWLSSEPGVRFVGAMLAVGASVAGVLAVVRWCAKSS